MHTCGRMQKRVSFSEPQNTTPMLFQSYDNLPLMKFPKALGSSEM